MPALIERRQRARYIAIETTDAAHLAATRRKLTAPQRRSLAQQGFTAAAGMFALLHDPRGTLDSVLVGVDARQPLAALAGLAHTLPPGTYCLADAGVLADRRAAALGWALGAYRYTRYRAVKREPATLAIPVPDLDVLRPQLDATFLVRDLVNTPTADLGPEELSAAVKAVGRAHHANTREWVGEGLLKANFPTIHAVGRASHRPPRLVQLQWGKANHPKLVLVGKGVCFDSGGLDLKSAGGMRWMKKDMGGAAHALALAQLVMQADLPVRLTLLVPTVENSVSGSALRPGDVVKTRAGLQVEIDNTDAEGRLILCDALAYASEQQPDLIVDFATLTGAARVALGPDLPALFANRDEVAQAVLAAGLEVNDPLWRLPLWQPYRQMLDSYLADFTNSGGAGHAGAITAALYLERFVDPAGAWVHLDTYAWNDRARPGRPQGGEAMGLRALFAYLRQRYRRGA
ncbi:MAG TPA: leucyl aminopeptidase family protein [Rhodanobacter sp.]|jgi:leucyl aminopeptidase|nr:leucyl aminopeptidase family protein [Rhodanobacter sp.]